MKRYQITFFGEKEQKNDVFFMYGILVSASTTDRGCFDIVIVRTSDAPMVSGTDSIMSEKASSEREALDIALKKIKDIPSLSGLFIHEAELPKPSPSLKNALNEVVSHQA